MADREGLEKRFGQVIVSESQQTAWVERHETRLPFTHAAYHFSSDIQ
jgi:hypothetical protein